MRLSSEQCWLLYQIFCQLQDDATEVLSEDLFEFFSQFKVRLYNASDAWFRSSFLRIE